MGKIITMTSEEIRKEWTPQKWAEFRKKKIPSFDIGITDDDYSSGRVKTIARNLDELKEYLKKESIYLDEIPIEAIQKNKKRA